MGKLLTLEEARTLADAIHAGHAYRTIVLCHGTFDIIHPGHVEHLRQAKRLGQTLFVGITGDAYIKKGSGRPLFDAVRRAEVLVAMELVDYVVIVEGPDARPIIEALHPDVYVKGPDYEHTDDPVFALERRFVEGQGGRVEFTAGFTASSSAIVNSSLSVGNHRDYLTHIRDKYGEATILSWIERCAALNALVVGDPIVDEYVFVKPAGKSPKESLVTFVEGERKAWQGGATIVAAHLSELCRNVELHPHRVNPTIKRRYIEEPFSKKVFSLAIVKGEEYGTGVNCTLQGYDLIIVADYGHGVFPSHKSARNFVRNVPEGVFLTHNTQSNSLNWGYNLFTKWPKSDYVVTDHEELRLACGASDWHGRDIRWWVRHFAERMHTRIFAVTLGHQGVLVWDGHDFVEAPALADKIVDRMGAGDAFYAYTAPLVALGAPSEIVAFIGSIASAIKIRQIGNEAVPLETVKRWIKSMLA